MAKRTATTIIPYTELVVATGNFDTSRVTIDRIIIHTMVASWQSAANRFAGYGTQVSAHYGVKLDGGLIHWLEEYFTAYHAGNYAMNQRSIGIEHEDNGNYNGIRPDTLYQTSGKLVADICKFYNIPIDRTHILKHSQIIPTGCPDALDIDKIVSYAKKYAQPPVESLAPLTDSQFRAKVKEIIVQSISPQDKVDKITALKP
jgi:N-acetyl-anhydromuramyl-L-alanine amidase AmpD